MSRPLALPRLETERMWLRPLAEEDQDWYCRLYTDPETMRIIGPPLSGRRAAAWFEGLVANPPGRSGRPVCLAMLEKDSNRSLGGCGVTKWCPGASELEAGILLLREARSSGFAREGMTALLRWLFETTTVEEVCVDFSSRCPAVRRLNEAVGFAPRPAEGGAGVRPGRLLWSARRASWCRA